MKKKPWQSKHVATTPSVPIVSEVGANESGGLSTMTPAAAAAAAAASSSSSTSSNVLTPAVPERSFAGPPAVPGRATPYTSSPYAPSPYAPSPYASPYGSSYSPYATPSSTYSPYMSSFGTAGAYPGFGGAPGPYSPYGLDPMLMPSSSLMQQQQQQQQQLGAGGPPSSSVFGTIQSSIQTVGTMTEGFAHLSSVLNHSWQTLYMSFVSLARVSQGLAQFRDALFYVVKAVTVFKLFQLTKGGGGGGGGGGPSLSSGGAGGPLLAPGMPFSVSEFHQYQRRKRITRYLSMAVCLAVLFGPPIVSAWRRRRRRRSQRTPGAVTSSAGEMSSFDDDDAGSEDDDEDGDDGSASGTGSDESRPNRTPASRKKVLYYALYPFQASRPDELSFQKDDRLLQLAPIDNDPNWVYAVNEAGRKGLIPLTHVYEQ